MERKAPDKPEPVEEFVGLVRQFVTLVEKLDQYSAYDFLQECALVLPRIYAAGLSLPDVESGKELGEMKRVESGSAVALNVGSLLGKYTLYGEVFDPVFDKDSVTGSLSDDISDIYVDLKEPLLVYERGDHVGAIWEWKFTLQTHAGNHIVDALRPIHHLITDHMPSDWRNS